MRKILFLVGILGCVLCLTGCTNEINDLVKDVDETINDIDKTVNSEENLQVEEDTIKTTKDTYAYYIEGYINNTSDKDYSYVQVTFTTYDKEGNTLGSCLDNNSGLEANGRWKFKAMCLEEVKSIASYKLKEVTGY